MLLDGLFVILLVMLPVALVIELLVMLFVTLLEMLLVMQLFTWLSAPISRSAVPARTVRTGNHRETYRILCAPFCEEIDSRKEGCMMTMGAAGSMNVVFYHRCTAGNNRNYSSNSPRCAGLISS
jgi:hypothetical protein